MPRPPRLHVPGGCYHVTLRGNHREPLFGSAADRVVLNGIVADVISRFATSVHAFCWMTNHLHAVVQISDHPLGGIMQRIAMPYSRYRHKALQTTGHLFERRYGAKLIDVDAYFVTVLRYVHLNPVEAHMVSDPAAYPWTSHRAYLGSESIPWLSTDFGLSLFGSDVTRARKAYAQFVLRCDRDQDADTDAAGLETYVHPEDPRVLGDDRFLSSLPVRAPRAASSTTLEQLARDICAGQDISVQMLRSRSSQWSLMPARVALAERAVEHGFRLTEVARFLGRDLSSMCKLMDRHRRKGR